MCKKEKKENLWCFKAYSFESRSVFQHYISHLISFVSLLTIFFFFMPMAIYTCSNKEEKNLQNYSHFAS